MATKISPAAARTADPRSPEGAALARAAAEVLVILAERRFPFAPFASQAVRDALEGVVGLVTDERFAGYPTTATTRVSGACAAAGAALDVVYALIAEHKYRAHTALEGDCPHRKGQLRFGAPPGATGEPHAISVPCSVHGVAAGVPCPVQRVTRGDK